MRHARGSDHWPTIGSWHGAHLSCTLPIWYLIVRVSLKRFKRSSYQELQEIRRRERVCVANQLSETRPTFGAVTKSGVGLGSIAIGKKASDGGCPWTATGTPSGGPRVLGSPHLQGPIKTSSFVIIVTSSNRNADCRREPTGCANVR